MENLIVNFILSSPVLMPCLVFGYLLGSIPTAYINARLAGHGDIRKIGSGNVGTTNVLRTGNKKLALLTLLGDILKAMVAVMVVQHFIPAHPFLHYLTAFAVMIGHIFPIWLRFKGGKGVAPFIGLSLALNLPATFLVLVCWLLVARLSRYSSLSALIATLHSPFYAYACGSGIYAWGFVVFAAIIWLSHHGNIKRLYQGTESKIGEKAKTKEA